MKTILSLATSFVLVVCKVLTLAQAPSTWEAIQVSNSEYDSIALVNRYPHESFTLGKLFFTGANAVVNGEIVENTELASFDGLQCELIDIGDIKPAPTDPPTLHRGIIYIADYLEGIVYAYSYNHDEDEPTPSEHRLRVAYYDGFDHELLFEFDSPNNKHTIYSVDDVIYVAGALYSGEVVYLKYYNGILEPFIETNTPDDLEVNGVYDMIKYQNELYFVLIPEDGPRQLWKHNGFDWSLVIDGNGNAPGPIPASEVDQVLWLYDEYLVVRCTNGTSEFIPTVENCSGLLFWDGQSWSGPAPLYNSTLSPGVTFYYIASIESELYARGVFTSGEDGVPLLALAKWDGSQWCGLQAGLEVLTTPPVAIATFQGSVYLTPQISWGSFYHIYRHDGETFAPCTLPLGIEEIKQPTGALGAFPNPANGTLTVTLKNSILQGAIELLVHDLHGRIVYRQNHPELGNGEARIEVGHLPAGLYTLHCTVDGVWVDATKIVVE